jgi:hypothetical protein
VGHCRTWGYQPGHGGYLHVAERIPTEKRTGGRPKSITVTFIGRATSTAS